MIVINIVVSYDALPTTLVADWAFIGLVFVVWTPSTSGRIEVPISVPAPLFFMKRFPQTKGEIAMISKVPRNCLRIKWVGVYEIENFVRIRTETSHEALA